MKLGFGHKLISCLTVVCFTFSIFQSPAYSSSEAKNSEVSTPAEELSSFQLSKDLGRIEENYKAGTKTVVLVRDAHDIPDAQKRIEQIIKVLTRNYGVKLVALEGAARELDPQIFKSFPDQKLLRQTLEHYFERGELAGGTAAAIFSKGVKFQGVENWDLYEEGIALFLKAMKENPKLEAQIKSLQTQLSQEKQKTYPKDLFEIDQTWLKFQANEIDLLTLLNFLSKFQGTKSQDLKLLIDETKKHDDSNVDLEVREIAKKIERHLKSLPTSELVKSDLSQFNQREQQFRTGRVDAKTFALTLKDLAHRYELNIPFSEALSGLAANAQRMQAIEGSKLFKELDEYVRSVKAQFLQNPKEQELDRKTETLQLLKRFTNLELDRNDWDKVKNEKNDPEIWFSFAPALISHLAFYENTEKRDRVLFENLNRAMSDASSDSAIFVAGGFHTGSLTETLKAKGISYILISPQIDSLPENSHYQDHMRGEVSWKEYFETEGGKISPYKAFVRGVRDELLSVSRESNIVNRDNSLSEPRFTIHDPRLLKMWRDQIIRDLAVNERIAEAGNYTPFIDETAQNETQKALIAKLDRFIDGLKHLQTEGKLNEQNVLQLLNTAKIQTAYTGVAQIDSGALVRAEVRYEDGSDFNSRWTYAVEGFHGRLNEWQTAVKQQGKTPATTHSAQMLLNEIRGLERLARTESLSAKQLFPGIDTLKTGIGSWLEGAEETISGKESDSTVNLRSEARQATTKPFLDILQNRTSLDGRKVADSRNENGEVYFGFNDNRQVVALAEDENDFSLQASDLVVRLTQFQNGHFSEYPAQVEGNREFLPVGFIRAIAEHNQMISGVSSSTVVLRSNEQEDLNDALQELKSLLDDPTKTIGYMERKALGRRWNKPATPKELVRRVFERSNWVRDLISESPDYDLNDFKTDLGKVGNILRKAGIVDNFLHLPILDILEAKREELILGEENLFDVLMEGVGYLGVVFKISEEEKWKDLQDDSKFITAVQIVYKKLTEDGKSADEILSFVKEVLTKDLNKDTSPGYILIAAMNRLGQEQSRSIQTAQEEKKNPYLETFHDQFSLAYVLSKLVNENKEYVTKWKTGIRRGYFWTEPFNVFLGVFFEVYKKLRTKYQKDNEKIETAVVGAFEKHFDDVLNGQTTWKKVFEALANGKEPELNEPKQFEESNNPYLEPDGTHNATSLGYHLADKARGRVSVGEHWTELFDVYTKALKPVWPRLKRKYRNDNQKIQEAVEGAFDKNFLVGNKKWDQVFKELARSEARENPPAQLETRTQSVEPLYRGTTRQQWEAIKRGETPQSDYSTHGFTWVTFNLESAKAYARREGVENGVIIVYKSSANTKVLKLTDDPGDHRRQGKLSFDDVSKVYDLSGNILYNSEQVSKNSVTDSKTRAEARGIFITKRAVTKRIKKIIAETAHLDPEDIDLNKPFSYYVSVNAFAMIEARVWEEFGIDVNDADGLTFGQIYRNLFASEAVQAYVNFYWKVIRNARLKRFAGALAFGLTSSVATYFLINPSPKATLMAGLAAMTSGLALSFRKIRINKATDFHNLNPRSEARKAKPEETQAGEKIVQLNLDPSYEEAYKKYLGDRYEANGSIDLSQPVVNDVFLLVKGKEVLGFSTFSMDYFSYQASVFDIETASSARRQGVGTQLWNAVRDYAVKQGARTLIIKAILPQSRRFWNSIIDSEKAAGRQINWIGGVNAEIVLNNSEEKVNTELEEKDAVMKWSKGDRHQFNVLSAILKARHVKNTNAKINLGKLGFAEYSREMIAWALIHSDDKTRQEAEELYGILYPKDIRAIDSLLARKMNYLSAEQKEHIKQRIEILKQYRSEARIDIVDDEDLNEFIGIASSLLEELEFRGFGEGHPAYDVLRDVMDVYTDFDLGLIDQAALRQFVKNKYRSFINVQAVLEALVRGGKVSDVNVNWLYHALENLNPQIGAQRSEARMDLAGFENRKPFFKSISELMNVKLNIRNVTFDIRSQLLQLFFGGKGRQNRLDDRNIKLQRGDVFLQYGNIVSNARQLFTKYGELASQVFQHYGEFSISGIIGTSWRNFRHEPKISKKDETVNIKNNKEKYSNSSIFARSEARQEQQRISGENYFTVGLEETKAIRDVPVTVLKMTVARDLVTLKQRHDDSSADIKVGNVTYRGVKDGEMILVGGKDAIVSLSDLLIGETDEAHHPGISLFFSDARSEARFLATGSLRESDPEFPYFKKGLELAQQGKLEEAISQFQQISRFDPEDPGHQALVHMGIGKAYGLQGQYDQAISHFKAALAISPDSADVNKHLGFTLLKMGKSDEAILYLREVLKINPQDFDARFDLAYALTAQNNYLEAISEYEKALKVDPNHLATRMNLAHAHSVYGSRLMSEGNYEAAVFHLKKAVEYDSNRFDAQMNLGTALANQGNYKEAIPAFERAIKLNPQHALAHFNLGNALYLTNDIPNAIANFERFIELKELNPNQPGPDHNEVKKDLEVLREKHSGGRSEARENPPARSETQVQFVEDIPLKGGRHIGLNLYARVWQLLDGSFVTEYFHRDQNTSKIVPIVTLKGRQNRHHDIVGSVNQPVSKGGSLVPHLTFLTGIAGEKVDSSASVGFTKGADPAGFVVDESSKGIVENFQPKEELTRTEEVKVSQTPAAQIQAQTLSAEEKKLAERTMESLKRDLSWLQNYTISDKQVIEAYSKLSKTVATELDADLANRTILFRMRLILSDYHSKQAEMSLTAGEYLVGQSRKFAQTDLANRSEARETKGSAVEQLSRIWRADAGSPLNLYMAVTYKVFSFGLLGTALYGIYRFTEGQIPLWPSGALLAGFIGASLASDFYRNRYIRASLKQIREGAIDQAINIMINEREFPEKDREVLSAYLNGAPLEEVIDALRRARPQAAGNEIIEDLQFVKAQFEDALKASSRSEARENPADRSELRPEIGRSEINPSQLSMNQKSLDNFKGADNLYTKLPESFSFTSRSESRMTQPDPQTKILIKELIHQDNVIDQSGYLLEQWGSLSPNQRVDFLRSLHWVSEFSEINRLIKYVLLSDTEIATQLRLNLFRTIQEDKSGQALIAIGDLLRSIFYTDQDSRQIVSRWSSMVLALDDSFENIHTALINVGTDALLNSNFQFLRSRKVVGKINLTYEEKRLRDIQNVYQAQSRYYEFLGPMLQPLYEHNRVLQIITMWKLGLVNASLGGYKLGSAPRTATDRQLTDAIQRSRQNLEIMVPRVQLNLETSWKDLNDLNAHYYSREGLLKQAIEFEEAVADFYELMEDRSQQLNHLDRADHWKTELVKLHTEAVNSINLFSLPLPTVDNTNIEVHPLLLRQLALSVQEEALGTDLERSLKLYDDVLRKWRRTSQEFKDLMNGRGIYFSALYYDALPEIIAAIYRAMKRQGDSTTTKTLVDLTQLEFFKDTGERFPFLEDRQADFPAFIGKVLYFMKSRSEARETKGSAVEQLSRIWKVDARSPLNLYMAVTYKLFSFGLLGAAFYGIYRFTEGQISLWPSGALLAGFIGASLVSDFYRNRYIRASLKQRREDAIEQAINLMIKEHEFPSQDSDVLRAYLNGGPLEEVIDALREIFPQATEHKIIEDLQFAKAQFEDALKASFRSEARQKEGDAAGLPLSEGKRAAEAKNEVPKPSNIYSINLDKKKQWLEEQERLMPRLASVIANNITYISSSDFETALQQSVISFNQTIGKKPYVVVVEELPKDIASIKSDLWVYALGSEKGLNPPVAVLAREGLGEWLSEHPEINDIAFFDDAAYSGSQLNILAGKTQIGLKPLNRKLSLHVVVPFMTNRAKEKLKTNNFDSVTLYVSNTIPTVAEILEKENISIGSKLHKTADLVYENVDSGTLMILSYKKPDHISLLSTRFSKREVIGEGVIVDQNGYVVSVEPFVENVNSKKDFLSKWIDNP